MEIRKVFARVYTTDLETAITFYENLTGEKSTGVSEFKGDGLDLKSTTVGNFLILCGTPEMLEFLKRTNVSMIVDSVKEFKEFLSAHGGSMVQDVMEVGGGKVAIIKHNDGLVVEYMEF